MRRLLFGMLAIGHPSNWKTPGETLHVDVGYFWRGLVIILAPFHFSPCTSASDPAQAGDHPVPAALDLHIPQICAHCSVLLWFSTGQCFAAIGRSMRSCRSRCCQTPSRGTCRPCSETPAPQRRPPTNPTKWYVRFCEIRLSYYPFL